MEKEQEEKHAEEQAEQSREQEEQPEQPQEQTKQTQEQPEQSEEQPQIKVGTPVQEKTKEPESQEEPGLQEEQKQEARLLDALKSNGTCTCSRCQADVKALMLTRLPPKYIVADNTSVPMLLTYYNNKFRVAIISQSIRACMDVKERPRHIL